MKKMYNKVVTAAEAVSHIPDNAMIGIAGVNVAGTAMELIDAIRDRYLEEGHPKDIDITNSGGNGYVHRLGVEGLVRTYYAGYPALDFGDHGLKFSDNNVIPVFHFTQGIGTQFYRAQAAGVPFLTKAPIGTYVDPRIDGPYANQKGKELGEKNNVVSVVEIAGEEYLHINLPKVTVVLIRATYGDADGNLVDYDEPIKNEILPMALAAHNNGGIVIAQVKNLVEKGQILGAEVRVPGMLVDYVVPCSNKEQWFPQNNLMARPPEVTGRKPGDDGYQPGLGGRHIVAKESIPFDMWEPTGTKMMMARRATAELWPGCICNVGLGTPAGIPWIVAQEGVEDMYYQTIELGAIGGYTGGGLFFSAAFNARAYLNHDEMFSFIDGHGLEITFLGAGNIGEDGSVNVTKISGRTNGSGGFVNISSSTPKIVFTSTHTAGGKAVIEDGKLKIIEQGKGPKFVKQVEQISFNGKVAVEKGQDVTYITERAVFKLINGKLTLMEYAPGLDVEKDVIEPMEFRPEISADLKQMDDYCFTLEPIGLKEKWENLLKNL